MLLTTPGGASGMDMSGYIGMMEEQLRVFDDQIREMKESGMDELPLSGHRIRDVCCNARRFAPRAYGFFEVFISWKQWDSSAFGL